MVDDRLSIRIPDADTPGWLRRQRRALQFVQMFDGGTPASPEALDELVEFVLEFVEYPADRTHARELVWGASQTEFVSILRAIVGADGPSPLVEESAGRSENGTGA